MTTFNAFRIHQDASGHRAGLEALTLDQLTPGEITVRVEWSAVNYKDALAVTGRGKILRHSPLVGGVDAAGRVEVSTDSSLPVGTPVVVTGGGIGEARDGGFAPYLRVPAAMAIPLPAGLSTRQAMIVGTAGFTAALALTRMEHNGQTPELGPILITGASGGVGSFATALCARHGYEIAALTVKPASIDYLEKLGAQKIILREGLAMGQRALEAARFGGVIDTLGGDYLGWAIRCVRPHGNVAVIGMASGTEFSTSVIPFILRGVNLLGINSVDAPRDVRERIWSRLAQDLDSAQLDSICAGEITLGELPAFCAEMLAGHVHGRTVVRVT
ncbi:MAG: YhdH/YhfP family quinone oxidoreductase [Gammaproteobacteria bacterium]|nr:YhdH/YhfP family quinone oxidoreductase [Gammaproteobacteria bacterium]